MSTEAAILRAIFDRRGDDTPRLAYADFLDDHADRYPLPAEARQRATLIRLQCEADRLDGPAPDCPNYLGHLPCECAACRRYQAVRELWEQARAVLSEARGGETNADRWAGPARGVAQVGPGSYRRGFVHNLTVRPDLWERHAAALLAGLPLEWVWLTWWPRDMTGWVADPGGLPEWVTWLDPSDGLREQLHRCERWPGVLFSLPHPTQTYGR
ncbi:TIGR02996 domain-containing protein [bacterium]|nr:TIGR02996 domain-containing protein [bacterium]